MTGRVSIKAFFLFAEAWITIALARLILVFVPFSKIVPMMGTAVDANEKVIECKHDFYYIQVAINRACRYSFWRTKCFEQALCAKWMLKRRKYASTIYFGIKKEQAGNQMQAHAWVICNNEIITGGRQAGEFMIISRFYR